MNVKRLATAVTLAFATAAGSVAYATPITSTNDNSNTATGPVPIPYAAATPPAVLLACTKDQHAVRMLVVPGAPIADLKMGNVPAHEFLEGIQEALRTPISEYNKADLDASKEALQKADKSMNSFIAAFNKSNQSRLALAVMDFGITHRPDPACAPQPAVPQP